MKILVIGGTGHVVSESGLSSETARSAGVWLSFSATDVSPMGLTSRSKTHSPGRNSGPHLKRRF